VSDLPELDDELRRRLRRRFGNAVDSWLDGVPAVLEDLADRWGVEFGTLIQRGSMSVVIRCRAADGRGTVLKASPERRRIAHEAAALMRWSTAHVPAVLAVDEQAGALLMEAIEPGTPIAESAGYPSAESIASLLSGLHAGAVADPVFQSVSDRICYLFHSGTRNYERRPDLAEVISPDLYERGRRLALRLAAESSPIVLLHGDLTAVNVLDGGKRGLVAIDPAPCLGDPAFDAVDLVFWRAGSVVTIADRAREFAAALEVDPGRLMDWCAAFAAMVALEIAEAGGSRGQVAPFLEFAARA